MRKRLFSVYITEKILRKNSTLDKIPGFLSAVCGAVRIAAMGFVIRAHKKGYYFLFNFLVLRIESRA
jgi:uncharacterized membrane protein YadS